MVISLCSPLTTHLSPFPLLFPLKSTVLPPARAHSIPARTRIPRRTLASRSLNQGNPPRSLFPGGYKRPEIKVPNLVLKLSSEDVFRDDKAVLELIDNAVYDTVGIVLLGGGDGGGKRLYESACLLKSVIRDRAYLLIDERVDIAAAVNASGVLLSDQGLPTIVARNTMMDAKTDSVILPLVARNVQTRDAALDASNSEGADFLIYNLGGDGCPEELVSSVSERVKIPIFIMVDSLKDGISLEKSSVLLKSGASGVVVSVNELNMLRGDDLSTLSYDELASTNNIEDESRNFENFKTISSENGFPGKKSLARFTRLEERDQQLIDKERSVLLEAISVIERATPLMRDISLLKDAVSQLDEPFLLVIVVIVCSTSTIMVPRIHMGRVQLWKIKCHQCVSWGKILKRWGYSYNK